jgi:exodeoxyribonuclease V gamma subunit
VAGGLDLETHYISANTVEEIVITPADISKEEASETLNILLDYYRLGHTQPLTYSLDFKFAMGDLAALTPEEFMKQLDKAFGAWGWISDAYLIREYQNGLFDDETTFEAYREYTTQIYGPVYEKFKR